MKKFLLSIFAVLFAFAGVQAQGVVYTLTPAAGKNSSYTGNCDNEINGITWNLEGNATMLPWRIGGKQITNVDRALYSKTSMDAAVDKVVVTSGANTITVNSAKLLVADNGDFTNAVEYSFNLVASGSVEIPVTAKAGSYYKFVFNVTNTSKNNKYILFSEAKFYGTAAGGGEVAPTLAAPTVSVADGSKIDLGTVITFTPAAGNTLEYAIADEVLSPVEGETLEIEATTAGQLSITVKSICGEESEEYEYVYYVMPNKPVILAADDTFEESLEVSIEAENGDIYYTLDGNDPTEESTLYKGSFTITETTTVKAIAVVDGVVSKVASATYKYVDPNIVIKESTISFANTDARKSQDGNAQVWSSGAITFTNNKSASTNAVVSNYNPVRLYANSEIILECASGNITEILFDCNSSSYATALKNSFGNTVISTVSGKKVTVTLDGTSNTFTIEKLSAQVRLDAVTVTYAESATPTAPYPPTLLEPQEFRGSMIVTISNIADGATVYYTTDESDPATSATRVEYTEPFKITATTTVKAVAVNEVGASEMATATYTLFVVEETTGYYIKVVSDPADWSGKYLIVYEDGTDAYVFNGKDEANGYVSAVTDGDVIKANSEIDAVAVTIATMEDGYSVKTANGYIYGTSNSNVINTNASAPQLNTIEFTADGVVITAGEVFQFNSASNNMRFRYYRSEQQSVQLYKYVEELPLYSALTVTEAGYATLYLGFNARIPSAVEAYTVTAVNSGWVSLTQVTGVLPANTGVIIKAPAGEYMFFNEATATADVKGNLLEGTLYPKNIEEEAYVLGKVDGVVGLYKAKMTDGAWLNNANKAYLPASVASGAASYSFRFGEGTTGIDEITDNRVQSTVIYDLTGRRVENISAPGIYIVNGVKTLVK